MSKGALSRRRLGRGDLLAAAVVLALLLLHLSLPSLGHVSLFQRDARAFLAHGTWPREYPYLASAEFLLPLALPLPYQTAWSLLEAAGWLGVVAVLARLGADRGLFAALLLLAGAEPAFGLGEAFPVLLVLLAFWALRQERPLAAGLWLAAAAAIRLYPLLFLPLWALAWPQARWRWTFLACALFACAGGWALAAVLWPHGAFAAVQWELSRPPEFESGVASFLFLAHVLGVPLAYAQGFGSTLALSPWGSGAVLAGEVALVVWLGVLVRDVRAGRLPVPEASLAALAGGLVLHKVLTPEYVLWLLPWVALVRRDASLWLLMAIASLLVFPVVRLATLVHRRDVPVPSLEMVTALVRNALLGFLAWRSRGSAPGPGTGDRLAAREASGRGRAGEGPGWARSAIPGLRPRGVRRLAAPAPPH